MSKIICIINSETNADLPRGLTKLSRWASSYFQIFWEFDMRKNGYWGRNVFRNSIIFPNEIIPRKVSSRHFSFLSSTVQNMYLLQHNIIRNLSERGLENILKWIPRTFSVLNLLCAQQFWDRTNVLKPKLNIQPFSLYKNIYCFTIWDHSIVEIHRIKFWCSLC